jgi:hypothetical protein
MLVVDGSGARSTRDMRLFATIPNVILLLCKAVRTSRILQSGQCNNAPANSCTFQFTRRFNTRAFRTSIWISQLLMTQKLSAMARHFVSARTDSQFT